MATLWLWETQGIYNELLQTSQILGADFISSEEHTSNVGMSQGHSAPVSHKTELMAINGCHAGW